MSKRTNSTKRDDRRTDVDVFVTATRAALDGFEQVVRADLDRLRGFLDEADRWAKVGGRKPSTATRYKRLTAVAYDSCTDGRCTESCKHRKASSELAQHYFCRTGSGDDLEVPVFAVLDMVAGDGPDLDEAMDDLLRYVGDALNSSRLAEDIMTRAFAAAGYVPPVSDDDEPDTSNAPCGAEPHAEANVVNLEDARMSKEIAELEQVANAQRDQLDAIAKRLDGTLPARARHLTLVVSNDVQRSNDSE